MLEKQVEAYLVREMKKLGGVAYKFTSPARRAVPDRICLFPDGTLVFVEVKTLGGKLSPLQRVEIQKLFDLNQMVEVVYSKTDVDYFIERYK